MFKKPRTPHAAPDPIADLEAAIMLSSEQGWTHYNVPLEERARLRPGVAALARLVACSNRS